MKLYIERLDKRVYPMGCSKKVEEVKDYEIHLIPKFRLCRYRMNIEENFETAIDFKILIWRIWLQL